MKLKNTFFLAAIVSGAALLSSCGTTTFSNTKFRIKSSDHQDINKGSIQQVSKIADYKVDLTKVTATYEDQTGHSVSTSRQSVETAKQFAIAAAIEKAKCDFLVSPRFDIEVAGTYIKATVIGYPAHYTVFTTAVVTEVASPEQEAPKANNPLQNMYQPKK